MRTYTNKAFLKVGLGMMILAALPILSTHAQDTNQAEGNLAPEQMQPTDPTVLISQIQEAIEKNDLQQAGVLSSKLGQQGESSVAAIQNALRAQSIMRGQLVFALGQINSESSTNTLLETAYRDSDASNLSLVRLVDRHIPRRLSVEELNTWIKRLQISDTAKAASTARLLSLCAFNDVEQRANPIIARLIKEASSPQPAQEVHGAYISQPALSLDHFLLALSQFNDPLIIRLLQKNVKAQTNTNALKWLTIGLGRLGDSSVASKLELIIKQEKDGSTKAVALRAYSHAAQQNALPLLKTYVDDKTVIGQSHTGPYYGLQQIAITEIRRIRAKAKQAAP